MKTTTAIAAICVTAILSSAGSTTAATLITSARIKDNTIQSRDIRDGTINSWDLAPGAVTDGGDGGSLPRGAMILADFCPAGFYKVESVRLENGSFMPMYEIDFEGEVDFAIGRGRSLSLCKAS